MADLEKLLQALKSKAGITSVEQTVSSNQVKLLCRLAKERSSTWTVVQHKLKKAEFDAPWVLDLSKVVFLKNNTPSGPLVHAHRIIIKADDLQGAINEICRLILASPNARAELDEIPLPGGGSHRLQERNGRGATLTSGSGASFFPGGLRR